MKTSQTKNKQGAVNEEGWVKKQRSKQLVPFGRFVLCGTREGTQACEETDAI